MTQSGNTNLSVVQRECLSLVKWQKDLGQPLLVLGFERQRKAVDDTAENFKQLADTVELLRLKYESVAHVKRLNK